MKEKKTIWALICIHCGKEALCVLNKPFVGMKLTVGNIKHKENLKPGDYILCQHCKKEPSLSTEFIKEKIICEK